MTVGEHGIYNIAEEDGTLNIDKAKKILGWNPVRRQSYLHKNASG